MERQTGILMPISSLPGNQGIGDFGKHTYRLIDAISKQHIRIWQILPLNPVGYGNSPYQPFSSYAGDESTSVWIHWQITDCLSKALSAIIINFQKRWIMTGFVLSRHRI